MGRSILHIARWLAWQITEPAAPITERPASITVFSSHAPTAVDR